MIERAKVLQTEKNLANISWRVGDIQPLPYPDGSFTIVICRYALHHMENPRGVVAEMARVCAPGGRVVIVDGMVSSVPEKAAAFNRMEKLRDPSHVRAMSLVELEELPRMIGLRHMQTAFYQLEMELEKLLAASFPNPGDAEKIRQIFADEPEENRMDLQARRIAGEIHYSHPIAIVVSVKTKNANCSQI